MTEQQTLRSDTSDSSPSSTEPWRNEIQARVARYRTRRGRRIEGTYSMRFPFGAAEEEAAKPPRPEVSSSREAESAVGVLDTDSAAGVLGNIAESSAEAAAAEPQVSLSEPAAVDVAEITVNVIVGRGASPSSPEMVMKPEPQDEITPPDLVLEADPEPLPDPVPRPPAKKKVIAFPRQATIAEEVYRLADPVVSEQPRILDVPEELEPFPTTPLLEGLQLLAAQPSPAASPDHIDLPFEAVTLPRRFCAGMVDCALVAAATGIFGGVAYKLLPKLELTKPLLLTASSVPILLWAVYQYVLTMYGGATAGMLVTKTRLSTFTGAAPNWRYRRSRVISLYFSTASLMMGVLWALVDVDALCWHDRISSTYLTKRK